jgi:hypothetical protein
MRVSVRGTRGKLAAVGSSGRLKPATAGALVCALQHVTPVLNNTVFGVLYSQLVPPVNVPTCSVDIHRFHQQVRVTSSVLLV